MAPAEVRGATGPAGQTERHVKLQGGDPTPKPQEASSRGARHIIMSRRWALATWCAATLTGPLSKAANLD